MKKALEGQRYRTFPIPEGIIFAYVDPKTGEIVPESYPDALQVALKAGTQLPVKDFSKTVLPVDTISARIDSLEKLLTNQEPDTNQFYNHY